MYVKVHKRGKQWFRIDNGALVGTEIDQNTKYYQRISKIIGNQILVRIANGEIKTIYYGHFVNNKFTRVQISEECSDSDCGYYAFVLD